MDNKGKYRHQLATIFNSHKFITCAGEETTLIYHCNLELPHFASIIAFNSEKGQNAIEGILQQHADIAVKFKVGLLLESSGWRASPDWASKLDLTVQELDALNVKSVDSLLRIRDSYETVDSPMIVVGIIGPRCDGYKVQAKMDIWVAEEYHRHQVLIYRDAGADVIAAMTMTYVEEAIGLVKAAHHAQMPVIVSFTVETNGLLPSGQMLKAAITEVDLVAGEYAEFFMINCAHPSHFLDALQEEDAPWLYRIKGIKVNASNKSHEELDKLDVLDDGDLVELSHLVHDIRTRFPWIDVVGGCCGTDIRHIDMICKNCFSSESK